MSGAESKISRLVARQLHDGLGQDLAALAHLADVLTEDLDRQKIASGKASRLATGLRRATQKIRRISQGLLAERAVPGFKLSLTRLAGEIRSTYEMECRTEVHSPVTDRKLAAALFYIAREAAINAAKHAEARTIVIRCDEDGLEVEDDGRGFSERERGGSGLTLMRERAEQIGARLEIAIRPEGGTRICCRLGS